MNVAMIYQLTRQRSLVAVVEWPEGKDKDEVLQAWCHANGLGIVPQTLAKYQADYCPVVPWEEIRRAGIAFCDQQWVIESTEKKGTNGEPLYWNNGGWVPRGFACSYNGNERSEMGNDPIGLPCKWVYVGP